MNEKELVMKHEELKSKLVIGNFTVYFAKHFNWFNRLMLKLVFGLNIEVVKVGENNDSKL